MKLKYEYMRNNNNYNDDKLPIELKLASTLQNIVSVT